MKGTLWPEEDDQEEPVFASWLPAHPEWTHPAHLAWLPVALVVAAVLIAGYLALTTVRRRESHRAAPPLPPGSAHGPAPAEDARGAAEASSGLAA